MRKLCVLLVAVFCFSFVPAIFAEEPVNSVRAAQVFGGLELKSFTGNFSFDRGKSNGGWVSYRFKMQGGKIIYLAQEGDGLVVIVGENDEPLSGVPTNAVGETRNFYLYLSTENGEAFGDFRKDLLLPGEPIEVILKPNFVPRLVQFSGKGTTKPENAVLKTEGGSFSYDQYVGGFRVWVDPLKVTAYTIMDAVTGLTISSGVIDPTKGAPRDTSSVINIRLQGGVVAVDDSYTYLSNQKLDGQLADGSP
ncbi:MAG: hypothetical protein V1685_04765, partial [Parcubacteria group bacterium]